MLRAHVLASPRLSYLSRAGCTTHCTGYPVLSLFILYFSRISALYEHCISNMLAKSSALLQKVRSVSSRLGGEKTRRTHDFALFGIVSRDTTEIDLKLSRRRVPSYTSIIAVDDRCDSLTLSAIRGGHFHPNSESMQLCGRQHIRD